MSSDDDDRDEDLDEEGEEDNSEELAEAIEGIEEGLEELEELIAAHHNPKAKEKMTESIPRIQEILDVMKRQLKIKV
jgi:hypothetical protein